MDGLAVRKYYRDQVIYFRKTKENFGGLSNMASGYIIHINNNKILSSEALYQACRYPHLPLVQKEIIQQASPMTAKMKSKKYRSETRSDWEKVKIQIMRWSLRAKLFNNWNTFSKLLLSTGNKIIVEESKKDEYWGAIPNDQNLLIGVNALGRLLMELREEIRNYEDKYYILNPPNIKCFKLFDEEIKKVHLNIGPEKIIKEDAINSSQMNLFD